MLKREKSVSCDCIIKSIPLVVRTVCFCGMLLFCSPQLTAAEPAKTSNSLPTGFVEKNLQDADGKHPYLVFVPPAYSVEKKWPVVLFLHGAGQKGIDGVRPIIAGLGTALEKTPDQNFIALFPQCENLTSRHLTCWLADSRDCQRALQMLKQVEADYSIDTTKRTLCGWSMGGFGAWSLAAASPDHWAGVLLVSGGQTTENKIYLEELAKLQTPVWVVHGKDDSLIPFAQDEAMIESLNSLGGHGVFTLVDGVGHDVWRYLFADPRTMQWLSNPSFEAAAKINNLTQNEPLPYMSQFYIDDYTHLENLPEMLSLRMGNAALEVISQGIPEVIPASALSGKLADIERTISAGDETIHFKLSEIEFDCKIASVNLEAISGGRFLAKFQMNPLRLTIGSASLKSASLNATTGQFEIRMGHREPVSLELEIQPSIGKNGLELLPLKQKFSIPDSNWHIVPPQKIEVDNAKFSKANIITGIVGGLYLQKDQIEETVLKVVPSFLDIVEAEIQSREAPKLAQLLWPLPALIPDLTISPSQVRTDAAGISLVFDMQIRTFRPAESSTNPVIEKGTFKRFDVSKIPATEELDFQVSLDAVDGIGRRVIKEGFAYINVLDLQNAEFTKLTQADVLHQFFPDVIASDSLQNWDVGLRLEEPFRIQPADQKSSATEVFIQLFVPSVAFEVRDQESRLKATLHFSLQQNIQIQTIEKNGISESLKVTWLPDPKIEVLSKSLKTAVNEEAFIKLFTQAWLKMSQSLSGKERPIPRVQFGKSALGLKLFTVDGGAVSLKFVPIQTDNE